MDSVTFCVVIIVGTWDLVFEMVPKPLLLATVADVHYSSHRR